MQRELLTPELEKHIGFSSYGPVSPQSDWINISNGKGELYIQKNALIPNSNGELVWSKYEHGKGANACFRFKETPRVGMDYIVFDYGLRGGAQTFEELAMFIEEIVAMGHKRQNAWNAAFVNYMLGDNAEIKARLVTEYASFINTEEQLQQMLSDMPLNRDQRTKMLAELLPYLPADLAKHALPENIEVVGGGVLNNQTKTHYWKTKQGIIIFKDGENWQTSVRTIGEERKMIINSSQVDNFSYVNFPNTALEGSQYLVSVYSFLHSIIELEADYDTAISLLRIQYSHKLGVFSEFDSFIGKLAEMAAEIFIKSSNGVDKNVLSILLERNFAGKEQIQSLLESKIEA